MDLYEIKKEEAYHVFRTGGTVYGSSVGSEERYEIKLEDTDRVAMQWVIGHTRLKELGVTSPVQYWTD